MILAAILMAPASRAQMMPLESDTNVAPLRVERREAHVIAAVPEAFRKSESVKANEISPVRFHKKQFIALSAAVYAAGLADMHQTMHNRKYSWWYETDPLAKPIARLPAPAYYATGLALATGVNWLSWKMGHSRRWHKLAPLPQLLSIAGNTYGYKSNCFPNY